MVLKTFGSHSYESLQFMFAVMASRLQIISKFSYIVIILLITHDCRLHSMSHKCRFRDVGLKRMDSFPQNV